jgi:hypothetical protein
MGKTTFISSDYLVNLTPTSGGSGFGSAESFDPELTTEGLVAGQPRKQVTLTP